MFEHKNNYSNDTSSAQPLRNPVDTRIHKAARGYRLQRVRAQLLAADCAAILL